MSTDNMPKLPEPEMLGDAINGWATGFTDEQMLAYGRLCRKRREAWKQEAMRLMEALIEATYVTHNTIGKPTKLDRAKAALLKHLEEIK